MLAIHEQSALLPGDRFETSLAIAAQKQPTTGIMTRSTGCATITTSLRTMTEIWRGDRSWSQALKAGLVTVDGPSAVSRDVPAWLGQSTLAAVPRPA